MDKKKFLKQDEKTIRKIHSVLLIIAKELKRICEKHDIKYFMLAGTLLGAIRHKGFIPWDDDMDFGMLRTDYDKFLEICKTELDHQHFFIQNMDTDEGFGKFYTRILLKDTALTYDFIKETSQKKCFFIDIFPYDNIPNSKIFQKKHCIVMSFALRLVKQKMGYLIEKTTLIGNIELLFEKFFSLNYVKELYKKEQVRYNKKERKYVTCQNAGYGYFKESLKKKWLLEIVDMQFEDISLPGLKEYDEYLKYMYGDYMIIPPEEDRITHEFKEIDFGPYDNILGE